MLRGPAPEDIALNQVDIDSARVALVSAQKNLAKATLVAPFAGVVTAVNIDLGAHPAATSAIEFADLSILHVDVPVDKIDLPSVSVSQPSTITLDAMPDTPLAGHVTAIAPSPTTTSDTSTTYDVTVTLDKQTGKVAAGMTANVEIETQRRQGVPVIPASVVQTDKNGTTFVDKLEPDGQSVHTRSPSGCAAAQISR